ncbi:hypothetical protein Bca4012_020470 [Brassica carinata]
MPSRTESRHRVTLLESESNLTRFTSPSPQHPSLFTHKYIHHQVDTSFKSNIKDEYCESSLTSLNKIQMTIINLDTYPRNKPGGGAIAIREVWAENLESEFEVISGVVDDFPFVSMNTEFHGVIFKSDLRRGNPADLYSLLKSNVDALSLIQVGLTLSDSDRNLPDLGDGQRFIWEFNFKDFDVARDAHAPDSSSFSVGKGSILSGTAAKASIPRGLRS